MPVCGEKLSKYLNKTLFYKFNKFYFFNLIENSVQKQQSYILFSC